MNAEYPVIYPLQVGVLNIEKSQFVYGRHYGTKIDAPVLMFVIKTKDQNILVDTGPCEPERAMKYHGFLLQDEEMRQENALQSIGLTPEDIDVVIFTHLHWDHCCRCDIYTNATFVVQKRELLYAICPNDVQKAQYEIGISGIEPPWIKVLQKIEVVEGDQYDFMENIHLITLPGHSPGFMGVLVNTSEGDYLIAGDTIPLMENWHGDEKLKHIPNGLHIDLNEYEETFKKMEKFSAELLAGHDFSVLNQRQYPNR
ncbi:N-acyl homoserine lactonase family protein [Sporosarcina sp. FSL W7-1349]|uniref:N-acyl homoserine lactonase family protein n=1 Tax=Sporosarcina sp. FSL W7-1349 TaxID=2921561 RepID=UPI0030F74DB7